MKTRTGMVRRGTLLCSSLSALGVVIAWGLFSRPASPLTLAAKPQPAQLSLFLAPSQIPAGEHWVLVGSVTALPEDLAASPATDGVSVLELQKLSKGAAGIRLTVSSGASGKLLRLSSPSLGLEAFPELYLGATPASLSADANLTAEDLAKGPLLVDGQHFMYGYLPANQVTLAALRIHNRSTGLWHCHAPAEDKAREAKQVPLPADPHFVAVDVTQTLPDTDGNGVPDFAEAPEVKPPTPEHLGVELAPGANKLDLVAIDEAGNASWRILDVFTTYTPAGQ